MLDEVGRGRCDDDDEVEEGRAERGGEGRVDYHRRHMLRTRAEQVGLMRVEENGQAIGCSKGPRPKRGRARSVFGSAQSLNPSVFSAASLSPIQWPATHQINSFRFVFV